MEWRRHADQILDSNITKTSDDIEPTIDIDCEKQSSEQHVEPSSPKQPSGIIRRYPQRIRQAPKKFDDFVK